MYSSSCINIVKQTDRQRQGGRSSNTTCHYARRW